MSAGLCRLSERSPKALTEEPFAGAQITGGYSPMRRRCVRAVGGAPSPSSGSAIRAQRRRVMALDMLAEPRTEARKALRPDAAPRIALVFRSFKGGGVAWVMLLAAPEPVARGFAVELVVDRTDGDFVACPRKLRLSISGAQRS